MQLSIEHGEGPAKRFSRWGDSPHTYGQPYKKIISIEMDADSKTLLILYREDAGEPILKTFEQVKSFSVSV